jgi:1-acyl-sn-glycerol-3-phosphate acyltransferase
MVAEATGRRRELPFVDDVPLLPDRWMWFGKFVVRKRFRQYDVHVHGIDRIPAKGPVILASNHIGYPDGPLLFISSRRGVHAMVKESMFRGPMGYGLAKMGQINVDRFHVDPRAVKTAVRLLRDNRVVAIFPEGARGRGDVSVTKSGAAYLALVTGAPVTLVALLGTREDGASTEAWPSPGARLDVVVGKTLRYGAVPWPRTKQQVAQVQQEIQSALAAHVLEACGLTGHTLPAPPPMPTTAPEE